MGIKRAVKSLLQNNPVATARRSRMRSRLKNKDFTLLTPNCLGGILLHDLGLRFHTPTINLMMTQTDFLQCVLHLKEYMSGRLVFLDNTDETCPCAELIYGDLPPVTVHFTHYETPEEAEFKWWKRAERINYDNLFIFIEERDGISKEDLGKLAKLPARGVVAFTCNEYPDLPYTVFIPKYHSQGEVGNILKKNRIDDSREYEQYFDFVEWFNQADGDSFNVQDFIK